MGTKGKITFKGCDVTRGIKAAEKAGMKVERVEIDKAGTISLIPSNGEMPAPSTDFDRWKTDHADSA